MSPTWDTGDRPATPPIGPFGWLLVVLRGVPLGLVCALGLILTLLLRLIEAPLFGARRPVTPFITRAVCTLAFPIMGMRFIRTGTPEHGKLAVVANHASWLDIFALNARQRIYFVSKAEVAGWAGIGWLARATGTVFIKRDPKEARAQTDLFRERLGHGHQLLFFPEGTSTDTRRVLPFKSTLFAAFFQEGFREDLRIQPVTVRYTAPAGQDPRFYGWWGDMEFGEHLLKVLAMPRQGSVEVIYHRSVAIVDFANRKDLTKALEDTVRGAL
ncbi:lysophospholipid acyltransferase family protein [Donghicola mangrovi]|uniref:1-acyl-sn-glycerol-3-phosphate acyltransferase n=1 Tax=Donghicola mangrovi TaxID=2729614 RepID=A0A850Q6I4_9RHOB|nr:lysophospholipid acyltransferase family protein [Donghicola mangrovi]NVO22648.1 1-acyl-sn-glycerol-3-phosphate acyltransferase [Donghicola mangrovi]